MFTSQRRGVLFQLAFAGRRDWSAAYVPIPGGVVLVDALRLADGRLFPGMSSSTSSFQEESIKAKAKQLIESLVHVVEGPAFTVSLDR